MVFSQWMSAFGVGGLLMLSVVEGCSSGHKSQKTNKGEQGPGQNTTSPRPVQPIVVADTVSIPESVVRDDTLYAGFRKDIFLPLSEADEPVADPVAGGRLFISGVAQATGSYVSAKINGETLDTLMGRGVVDWFHVWPRNVRAGEPVWISLHTSSDALQQRGASQISVETSAGTALSGNITLQANQMPLTTVTTANGYRTMVIHMKNESNAEQTISRMTVNGFDVTTSLPADTLRIAARKTGMWLLSFPSPFKPGDPWSVVVSFANGAPSVGVGRILNEFFPVHAWPSTSDCPYPGASSANFTEHILHGINTFFVHNGPYNDAGCNGLSGNQIVTALAQNNANVWSMPKYDVAGVYSIKDKVAARLLGDEADGSKDLQKTIAEKVGYGWASWNKEPDIPTYIGGSRNRRMGLFSGIADIQGMDFYVAACAPHITKFLSQKRLRTPYDYAAITQKNHAPLPTWIYAQGFSPVWNATTPLLGGTVHRQPMARELLVQAMSAVASGAKGLMWFQTNKSETMASSYAKQSWEALRLFNKDVQAVSEYLRVSAPTGAATASAAGALTEALRGPDTLLVPVVNVDGTNAPGDLECGAGMDGHWNLKTVTTNIVVNLPQGFAVSDAFEVSGGQIREAAMSGTQPGIATFTGVVVSESVPVRLLVLARNPTVRSVIQSRLSGN